MTAVNCALCQLLLSNPSSDFYVCYFVAGMMLVLICIYVNYERM